MPQCSACITVPLLGFEPNPVVANKDEQQPLEWALHFGYRYVSSNGTPENERNVGKVLQQWIQQDRLKREEVFISTLLDSAPEDVEQRIKQSLSNLHLTYVDLCLLETPKSKSEEFDLIKLWAKMEATVTSGKAKYIGVSNISMEGVRTILKGCSIKPSCVQLEMHVDSQQHQMVDFCRRNGICVIARIALENQDFSDLSVNAIVKKIARKHGKSVAQILLKYLMQSGFSVVPKCLKKSRMKEYADVHSFSLDGVDVQQLDALNIESCCGVYDCAALKRSLNSSEV